MIAIGGTGAKNATALKTFDPFPFMLKGPVPERLNDIDDNLRKHHLRPSSESRVAVLSVPTLATHDLAPYVEIHYNAVDFTGLSMGGFATGVLINNSVNYTLELAG